MVEHTPGPWEVEDDLHTPCVTADAADGTEWIIADLGLPCDLVGLNPENLAKSILDERDANARLIAEAPALLDAGSRLLKVFDQQKMTTAERIIVGVSDAGLKTEGNAAIEALRAAIARTKSLTSTEEG